MRPTPAKDNQDAKIRKILRFFNTKRSVLVTDFEGFGLGVLVTFFGKGVKDDFTR